MLVAQIKITLKINERQTLDMWLEGKEARIMALSLCLKDWDTAKCLFQQVDDLVEVYSLCRRFKCYISHNGLWEMCNNREISGEVQFIPKEK